MKGYILYSGLLQRYEIKEDIIKEGYKKYISKLKTELKKIEKKIKKTKKRTEVRKLETQKRKIKKKIKKLTSEYKKYSIKKIKIDNVKTAMEFYNLVRKRGKKYLLYLSILYALEYHLRKKPKPVGRWYLHREHFEELDEFIFRYFMFPVYFQAPPEILKLSYEEFNKLTLSEYISFQQLIQIIYDIYIFLIREKKINPRKKNLVHKKLSYIAMDWDAFDDIEQAHEFYLSSYDELGKIIKRKDKFAFEYFLEGVGRGEVEKKYRKYINFNLSEFGKSYVSAPMMEFDIGKINEMIEEQVKSLYISRTTTKVYILPIYISFQFLEEK